MADLCVRTWGRLLNSIEGVEQTYTFTVVDQSLVNAWATPDAYIFVTRGILSFLSTEDELAAVLGHGSAML